MKELRNELRIGNYFDQFGNIHQIGWEDLKTLSISATHLWCKPIPLTNEWLQKVDWNGYKDGYFNSYFSIENRSIFYCGDFTGIVVDSVHELQNLYFALTKQELRFKN
jgi:hypothetical protein